jgi:hypothetical protein
VKKSTGGFDNGLGATLISEHRLASFLSKKSPEGISGLFQQHRSKAPNAIWATPQPMSGMPSIATRMMYGDSAPLRAKNR